MTELQQRARQACQVLRLAVLQALSAVIGLDGCSWRAIGVRPASVCGGGSVWCCGRIFWRYRPGLGRTL